DPGSRRPLPFVYKGNSVSLAGGYKYVEGGKAVIVEAVLLNNNQEQKKLWVKLSQTADVPRAAEQEKRLFSALAAVQKTIEKEQSNQNSEPQQKPKVQVAQLDTQFTAQIAEDIGQLN